VNDVKQMLGHMTESIGELLEIHEKTKTTTRPAQMKKLKGEGAAFYAMKKQPTLPTPNLDTLLPYFLLRCATQHTAIFLHITL
jgi:hypothetical protein